MKLSWYSITTAIVLIMVLVLCAITTCACIDGSKGLEYEVNSDGETCTITGLGTYSSKDLVIPDTIGDCEVTAIADYAFQGTDIETFSGGKNLTRIGMKAFDNCSELKKVDLPTGITEIGYGAFAACAQMTEINIPNTVKTIGATAFTACASLKDVTLPDGLITIGGAAFTFCVSLEHIYFPASVVDVDAAMVSGNNLTSIAVDPNNPVLSSVDGNLYAYDNAYLISYACAKIDNSFDVPEGVQGILAFSFAGCSNLESISIPKSVTYIGVQLFYYSPNIEILYYDGTIEDWKRIDKEDNWNAETESIFTIICTDGTIAMDGKITYN